MPPALFLSAPLDTVDQRYIDSKYTLIVNPLMGTLKVELYNGKCLQLDKPPVTTTIRITDKTSSKLDTIAFTPHHITPTLSHPIIPSLNSSLQPSTLCPSPAPTYLI